MGREGEKEEGKQGEMESGRGSVEKRRTRDGERRRVGEGQGEEEERDQRERGRARTRLLCFGLEPCLASGFWACAESRVVPRMWLSTPPRLF